VDLAFSLIAAAVVIYALARERKGAKRHAAQRRSNECSPFDEFYSDRPH
jgi:hypothetical protein